MYLGTYTLPLALTWNIASLPLIEDASIDKTTLSSTLFPGVSSSVEAHSGFAGAQAE